MNSVRKKNPAAIHASNCILLAILASLLFFRELGLSVSTFFHTILLPQTDLFGEYLYSRNIQASGKPWATNLLNYPDGANYPIPFHLMFDFRRWFILWVQVWPLKIDPIVAVNFSILVAFILSAFSIYYVLTRLKVDYFLSFSLALIWTISPWHILRIQHGFVFVDLSVVALTLLLIARITTTGIHTKEISLKRSEYVIILGWILTSGSYYIYFSLVCILFAFFFTLLITPVYNEALGDKEPKKIELRWIATLFIFSAVTLAAQFLIGKMLVSQNLQSDTQSFNRAYADIWTYGGFIASLFVSFTAPFGGIFNRLFEAANTIKPGSLCYPDTLKSNLMDISCTKNFESFMFLNTGLMFVVLFSFIVLIILRFLKPGIYTHNTSKRRSGNPALKFELKENLRAESRLQLRRLVFTNFGVIALVSTGAGSSLLGLLSANFRVYGRLLIYVVGLSILISAIFFRDYANLKIGSPKRRIQYLLIVSILILTFIPAPKFANTFTIYSNVQSAYSKATVIMDRSDVLNKEKCVYLQYPANTSIYPNNNRVSIFTEQQVFPYLLGSTLFNSAGKQDVNEIDSFNLQFGDAGAISDLFANSQYCFLSVLETDKQNHAILRKEISDRGGKVIFNSKWSFFLNDKSVEQRFYLFQLQK